MQKDLFHKVIALGLISLSLVSCNNSSEISESTENPTKVSGKAEETKQKNRKKEEASNSTIAVNIQSKIKKGSNPKKKEFTKIEEKPEINQDPFPQSTADRNAEEEKAYKESQKEEKENTQKTEGAILVNEDGVYNSGYNPVANGEDTKYGGKTFYELVLDGNNMIIKGSFNYYIDGEIEGQLPNNTYLFELTDNTEFYGVGADGAFPIKRSDFIPPPSLTLKVLNGKVVRVSSSS